jgi:hypothetical protein
LRYGERVPSVRIALAALTAATTIATGVSAAATTPRPARCKAPASGFHTCLSVLYTAADDGSVRDARVVATVVERQDACPRRTPTRRLTISSGGRKRATARPDGRCRRGVTTWRATFTPSTTKTWDLWQGETIRAAWAGVKHPSKVKLR